ncbi:MAG: aspartate carbamoyltransferase, partial [Bacteroidales bacterium]|nr:aspartate carbamoyltransferase [Bacteroidales bacterium]
IKALSAYEGIKVYLIAPDTLKLPEYIRHDVCYRKGIPYEEVDSIEEAMPNLDILYMTRVQKERFLDQDEFDRLKDNFILNAEKMKLAKKEMAVLHPLPRVNEILTEVDADPRAAYFRQVACGKYVRMALIKSLIDWKDDPKHPMPEKKDIFTDPNLRCTNPKCMCNHEHVTPYFKRTEEGVIRCAYCESKI